MVITDGPTAAGALNPGPRPLRLKPLHALLALSMLALLAIVVGSALSLREQRARELVRAEQDVANLARALTEQTARAIESADLILQGARERLQADRAAGYLMEERSLHTLLQARIDGIPQVRALTLANPDGTVRASSWGLPAPAIPLKQRQDFAFLSTHEGGELYVARPMRSLSDGRWSLPLSRRIEDASGGFAGMVTAAVDPDYFENLYRSLELDPSRSIALYLRDGTLIASTAEDQSPGQRPAAASPVFQALAPPAAPPTGLIRTGGADPRFIAYGGVGDYPLVVAVELREAAALAGWRDNALAQVWGATGIMVVLAVIAFLLARELTRGEALSAALGENRARLQGIIDSAMDAIVTVDKHQRIVLFNQAAERTFHCSAAEALGQALDRFIPQPYRGRHREHVQRFAATGVSARAMGAEVEIVGLRADGQEFPADVSISQVQREDGPLYTAIVRDITERRRAEEEVRKLSRVVEQTASSIIITDLRGRIEYVNPRFEQATGYAAAEVLGHSPSVLKSGHTSDAQYRELWQTITNGGVWHGEFRNRRKDGSLFWESAIVSPIRGSQGQITHFVAIKDDISDRKAAEEALSQSHQQLQHMAATLHSLREEQMSELARELHDELGQRLTGLKMDLSWLDGRLEEGQGPLRDKVAGMKALVDGTVKSVRRIATGLRPLVLDDLGVVAAVEWLVEDFSRHHDIQAELDLGMEDLALDDRRASAIFRIVQESLTNVARHSGAQRVEVSMHREGDRLLLRIEDDGKGMPPEAAAGAKGFGLVGIRERVSMCGGQLTIANGPTGGTAIEASIPIGEEAA
jgi:PAS domain S-box-containing protein